MDDPVSYPEPIYSNLDRIEEKVDGKTESSYSNYSSDENRMQTCGKSESRQKLRKNNRVSFKDEVEELSLDQLEKTDKNEKPVAIEISEGLGSKNCTDAGQKSTKEIKTPGAELRCHKNSEIVNSRSLNEIGSKSFAEIGEIQPHTKKRPEDIPCESLKGPIMADFMGKSQLRSCKGIWL